MSFSFDDALITALDRVRDAIGDRDATDPLRSDEQIEQMLINAGTTATATTIDSDAENAAVAILAGGLYREFARKPSSFSKSGGISISWGNRVAAWKSLAEGVGIGVSSSSSWGTPVLVGTGSFARPEMEG